MRFFRLFIFAIGYSLHSHSVEALESENIVGYARPLSNRGTYICTFQNVTDGTMRLGDIAMPSCSDIVLSFATDSGWKTVVSAEAEDGKIHWFDRNSDFPADEYEVRQGVALSYSLPNGEENDALTFSGAIDNDYIDNHEGSMFADRVTLGDLRMSRSSLERIVGPLRTVITNNVEILQPQPSRFRIVYNSGKTVSARLDLTTMSIRDPETFSELRITPEEVRCFSVETNKAFAADCLSERQVAGLMKSIVESYKEKQAAELKAKAEDAFADAILSLRAAWKWAIGIFGAVFVTKFGEYIFRKLVLLLQNLSSLCSRWFSKRRGKQLYRKMMKESRSK